ncbi:MAG: hypothetical protein V2A73_08030, partial [Pseudomonadota bacterium]
LRQGYAPATVRERIKANLAAMFRVSEPDGTPNPLVCFGFNIKDADGHPAGEVAWSDVFNVIRDTEGVRKLGDLHGDLKLNGLPADVKIGIKELPVPDLTIDLTAPGRAYDRIGQRIFFGTGQRVDCAVDHSGIPTGVTVAGKERWLGVFLRFDRLLSDPRTDGNSQQVFFREDESFELVVRQSPEGSIGAALKVSLQDDELLVCDVLRRSGQTQILAGDIDSSRRQAFVFASGSAVEVLSGLWSAIAPAARTVQSALDSVDSIIAGHLGGTAYRHAAGHVDYTPHGFVSAGNVQAAVDELVDDLSSATAGNPGASRIGADAVVGIPNALAASNVDSQLSQLLGWLNSHVGAAAGAHNASAIAAAAHNYLAGTSVQAQLQEIVAALLSQAIGTCGASRIGADGASSSPTSLGAGTVRSQLGELLGAVNARSVAAELASQTLPGTGLIGAVAAPGSPDSLAAGTVAEQLAAVLALINARARKSGDTFGGNLIPDVSGRVLGEASARWAAFLQDANATASATDTPAIRAYAFDAATPAIRAAGGAYYFEGEAIEASHFVYSVFDGPVTIWDFIKGWTFLPQHSGDVPDAVEVNGVTQRNIVKAWGSVSAVGTLLEPHWNVASITRLGAGRYGVTLDVSPGTRKAVVATISTIFGGDYSIWVSNPDDATFQVAINGNGLPADQGFMFVVMGA